MTAAENLKPEPIPQIFVLIPKIMSEIGAIGKNGNNSDDDYQFRKIDDVYNALQPVLSKHGVFFVPTILESSEEKLKNGQVRIKLKVKYMIYANDGSKIETIVEGESIDKSDKGTNKALTAAFKYMLIQIFCIAVAGMDDADSKSPKISEPKVVKQKGVTKKTTTVEVGHLGRNEAPIHCGEPMMISNWTDRNLGHKPWFCLKCKAKIAREEGA